MRQLQARPRETAGSEGVHATGAGISGCLHALSLFRAGDSADIPTSGLYGWARVTKGLLKLC